MKPSTRSTNEPIAIIGIGCRFPGHANDPESFWEMLCKKTDAISEIPPERWNASKFYDPIQGAPGKYYTMCGGFVENIQYFDSSFFGISPREAQRMDPHQKILLEVAWEAFFDAGIPIDRNHPLNAGVFIGISSQDYTKINSSIMELDSISIHTATGISFSIAANRISHNFNLRGPSVALDTACSSSLTAVHLACRSLADKECTVAAAGGVNIILSPDTYVSFCNLSMLSPDGRCKVFDAGANGFVRGEGAGVVILKPLAQARKDNDRIYAVICGTCTNQDARTPGITIPSMNAQEELLEQVCRNAGIDPGLVAYVETHGTGTALGDPIEAKALGHVIGKRRPKNSPLVVGSVKTNIGHLESAAGIAGLIKTALVLKQRRIPPNLHFVHPNPDIPFDELNLKVPVGLDSCSDQNPLYGGISSFGFGGSNAHVLLSAFEAKASEAAPETIHGPELFCISMQTKESLKQYAEKCLVHLRQGRWSSSSIHDICGALLKRRTHHPYRFSSIVESKDMLETTLTGFLNEEYQPGMFSALSKTAGHNKTAFVFSGQGPQWWGMGRELMDREIVYRKAIEQCDQLLRLHAEWSLIDELNRTEETSRMHLTSIAQPAIFSLQFGLLKLWESWGIHADACIGHSVGEVAAAYAAGVLSIEDAIRVIFHRGRCMEFASAASGRMLAVGLSSHEIEPYIRLYQGKVNIGAVNSPESVTLAGDAGPLEIIEKKLKKDDVYCQFLQSRYAFHSHHMDGMRDKLLLSLKDVRTRPACIPVFSTVSGKEATDTDFTPEYWWRNVREPVKFAQAMEELIKNEFSIFLELSPHPVLANSITESLLFTRRNGTVLPSIKRKFPERFSLLSSLGALHDLGVEATWSQLYPGSYADVTIPGYDWNREYSWHQSTLHRNYLTGAEDNALIGAPISRSIPAWENQISIWTHPYLKDHRVHGHILFPGTCFLEAAYAAVHKVTGADSFIVEDVSLVKSAFISDGKSLNFRTEYDPGELVFKITSMDENDPMKWNLNASGSACSTNTAKPGRVNLDDIKNRCRKIMSDNECYALFNRVGMDYGRSFKGVRRIFCGAREALAEIIVPEQLRPELKTYHFHPAVLDSCLHAIIGLKGLSRGMSFLPVSCRSYQVYAKPDRHIWSYVRSEGMKGNKIETDIQVMNSRGSLIADIRGLLLTGIDDEREKTGTSVDDMLYRYEWIARGLPKRVRGTSVQRTDNDSGCFLVIHDKGKCGQRLVGLLESSLFQCISILPGVTFEQLDHLTYRSPFCTGKDIDAVFQSISRGVGLKNIRGIIDLKSLDIPPFEHLSDEVFTDVNRNGSLRLLALTQEMVVHEENLTPRLWIVTRGAQQLEDSDPSSPFASSVWGFGRVMINELPGWRCTLIDLEPVEERRQANAKEIKMLYDEIQAEDKEDEVVFRKKLRHIPRLRKTSLLENWVPDAGIENGNFRLETARAGILDNLQLRKTHRQAPGDHEVEIGIFAAGLNFSDVMKLLNLYPGLQNGPIPLGLECAGKITGIGCKVEGLKIGDRVMALTPFCFSAYVTVREQYVIPIPSGMSYEEAATFPVAFLTAHYALITRGGLAGGERVLIHSATGGVGMAALQIARHVGAEIFASAGTPQKRNVLKRMGLKYVMDSRSLDFAPRIMDLTKGEGIDVILNSLSGEAIPKGVSLLRDYGRFLEIGKRDIYRNKRIGLYPFHKNLSFSAIDLDKMMRDRADIIKPVLKEISERIEKKIYKPLPHRSYPISRAADAFRIMSSAKHVGKILITPREQGVEVMPAASTAVMFHDRATYLISGGFGGFGLIVAEWLVKNGARHLVLMGRHGADSSRARKTVSRIRKTGTQVVEILGDVSNRRDVSDAFSRIDKELPPLRGVVHTAMVLDDALLINLSPDRMNDVLKPKAKGAWLLHQHTRDLKLDFFILFSSVSSLIGMPGQGNYVAANGFLDGLSAYRRSQKLPSMTINWGFLGKVGIAARSGETSERFENQGLNSFSPEQALEILARFIRYNPVRMAVLNIDWNRFGDFLNQYSNSPKFSELWKDEEGTNAGTSLKGEETTSIRKLLHTESEKEKAEQLRTVLLRQAARILGMEPERLELDKALTELGFDSLMAVEFRNWVEKNLGVVFPTLEFMRGPSINQLTEKLLRTLAGQVSKDQSAEDGETHVATAPPGRENLSVDELSDEDVDSMLRQLLDENSRKA